MNAEVLRLLLAVSLVTFVFILEEIDL